jgi:small GTP-binding protein
MKNEEIKISILGDEKIGKTSFVMTFFTSKYQDEFIPSYYNSIKATIKSQDYNEKVLIHINDTPSKDKEKRLNLIKNTKYYILCFDITNENTLQSIKEKWIPEIKKINIEENTNFLILGLKKDLRDNNSVPFETGLLLK